MTILAVAALTTTLSNAQATCKAPPNKLLYYHDYVQLAEACAAKDPLRADSLYRIAFQRYEKGTATACLHAASVAARLGQMRRSADLLNKGLACDVTLFTDIQRDSVLATVLPPAMRDSIIAANAPHYTEYLTHLDSALIHRLALLEQVDQGVRKAMGLVREQYADDSPLVREFWKYFEVLDGAHADSLKAIMAACGGVPGLSKVGATGTHAFWTLSMHVDNTLQKRILPEMELLTRKGDFEWIYWAYLSDRVQSLRPPHHNTYALGYYSLPTGDAINFPDDPYCVDYLREQLGIEPIYSFGKDHPCPNDKR